MAKRHSNPTDSGSESYPPIHNPGSQGFVSPLCSPVEKPFIGVEVDDSMLYEDAPNPGGFPGVDGGGRKGRR